MENYGARFTTKSYPTIGIYTDKVNAIWAVDLLDIQLYDHDGEEYHNYVLSATDIFSRRSESVRLQRKDKATLGQGFRDLFQRFGAAPEKVWSDQEPSLLSNDMKRWFASLRPPIHLYHTWNSYYGPNTHSCPIAERFNRTLRDFVIIVHKNGLPPNIPPGIPIKTLYDTRYLIDINKHLNNREHRTLHEKPMEVYTGRVNNDVIREEHGERYTTKRLNDLPVLKIGTHVRLADPRKKLRNKHAATYSDEVMTITGIRMTNPITYELDKFPNGAVYRKQMKVLKPNDSYYRNNPQPPAAAAAGAAVPPAPVPAQQPPPQPADAVDFPDDTELEDEAPIQQAPNNRQRVKKPIPKSSRVLRSRKTNINFYDPINALNETLKRPRAREPIGTRSRGTNHKTQYDAMAELDKILKRKPRKKK